MRDGCIIRSWHTRGMAWLDRALALAGWIDTCQRYWRSEDNDRRIMIGGMVIGVFLLPDLSKPPTTVNWPCVCAVLCGGCRGHPRGHAAAPPDILLGGDRPRKDQRQQARGQAAHHDGGAQGLEQPRCSGWQRDASSSQCLVSGCLLCLLVVNCCACWWSITVPAACSQTAAPCVRLSIE